MLQLLLSLSLRNLRTHKISTFIVGAIIFFGSWLSVCGSAFLHSLETTLANTLISSVAGHLQVYSAQAHDDLALFGSGFSAVDDVGQMKNFAQVKDVLVQDKNVAAVVPMGIAFHALISGNELDQALGVLAQATMKGDTARIEATGVQIRDIARAMEDELQRRSAVAAPSERLSAHLSDVRRVQSAEFWQHLRHYPGPALQFLDSQVAPLAGNNPPLYLRNLGTDLPLFTRHFARFSLTQGQAVPPNTRGFLFARRTYERQLKHPIARSFDELYEGLQPDSHLDDLSSAAHTLAADPVLRDHAQRLPQQYQRISFQLDPKNQETLSRKLREELGTADRTASLDDLLKQFLQVNDHNFLARYQFFYATIAPMIRLYAVNIGDMMTLQAVTRSGYTKSVKVRVYGTFEFTGLDRSTLATGQNLMDLMTFRELYGDRDVAQEKEIEALQRKSHVADISREDAEAQMFTDTHVTAERTAPGGPVHLAAKSFAEARRLRQGGSQTFSQKELDQGLALNAAVILRQPQWLEQTQAHLQALLQHAGLQVQVVDWRTASGLVSRFIQVVHLFLFICTGIIFVVASVIMSNALTMATTERTREIGTLRAIGGQRRFVLAMYFVETTTLGLMAGSLGALAAYATVKVLHRHGIAAASDVMVFLFAGPRFYPNMALQDMGWGLSLVLFITLLATLYPARLATRINPVVAMAAKE
jgi:ABC-type lipoprotein release transport system permease subunit